MIVGLICVVAGIFALAHVAPFPFIFDAAAGKTSVWRAPEPPGKKTIYLTFDDGPNPSVTPQLLHVLRDKQVHATFFIIDDHVTDATAPIVKRIFDEGHAVGLHSSDRWLMLSSGGALGRRLAAASAHIEKAAGRIPCPLFRPHAGWRSPAMLRTLGRLMFKLVGWSWMSWDWNWFRKRTGKRVASQILAHAAPGKIIVIHDGHHKNPAAERAYAVEAVPLIIDGLRARGYEFRTLCENTKQVTPAAGPVVDRTDSGLGR
jgi:peptidoglycan/xylan/chitin deacetylase (PgdA/CDA1 family)